MRLNIKRLKRLPLFFIALYIAIAFLSILLEPIHDFLLNCAACNHLILRTIMACTALVYYVFLNTKNKIRHPIHGSPNVYSLTIGTICMQFIMTFALLLLSNIKETLWHPSLQPVLCFSSTIDFLCRGVLEISCLAAILEEVVFRGILEKLISKVTSIRLWITVISALAFTFMHCNMGNNLFYFIMGCFLSQLYHQTQHIVYPIIAHGFHNLCAVSMMYLRWDERFNLLINKLPILMRLMLALAALLVVYSYMKYILVNSKTKHVI